MNVYAEVRLVGLSYRLDHELVLKVLREKVHENVRVQGAKLLTE